MKIFYEKFYIFQNKFSEMGYSIFVSLHISLVSGVLEDSWIHVTSVCSLSHRHPTRSPWKTLVYTCGEIRMKKAEYSSIMKTFLFYFIF